MQVILTTDEARTLREYLRDHFREVQLEIARTEVKDFRHILQQRQDVIESVLRQLEPGEAALA